MRFDLCLYTSLFTNPELWWQIRMWKEHVKRFNNFSQADFKVSNSIEIVMTKILSCHLTFFPPCIGTIVVVINSILKYFNHYLPLCHIQLTNCFEIKEILLIGIPLKKDSLLLGFKFMKDHLCFADKFIWRGNKSHTLKPRFENKLGSK